MSDIEVRLPDGSTRALPGGSSAHDLASAIGKRLAKDALAAQVNGQEIVVDGGASLTALSLGSERTKR